MATTARIDDPEQGKRLTARPGPAAAERQPADGDCLTPEQLADVATNHCTPEKRKAALAHIGGCRECYDAWVRLSLSLLAMEDGLERGKKPLLSLRNLGYLVSAVAVAVCVVVFFIFWPT